MDKDSPVWAAIFSIIIVVVVFGLYYLGTIIGFRRDVRAKWALFLINSLVGWTVIGWIVCIIWGVTGATQAQDAFYRSQGGGTQ